MKTNETKQEKSKLQFLGSTFVIITGLFVLLAIGNTITGNVTAESPRNVNFSEITIVFWGLLIIAAGIWMLRKPNFHKSVFD